MNKTATKKESSVLKIFNYLGGALIFLGVSYFIFNNWGILNDFTRIFSTLGSAIAAFIIGMLFHAAKKYGAASAAFFMLSGLLFPIGLQVSLNIANFMWSDEICNLFIGSICFIIFLVAELISPRTIFLLFSIIFGSLLYVFLMNFFHIYSMPIPHIDQYEIIALGMSYILLGYYLDQDDSHSLVGPLYFFGCLFVLAESFCLGSVFIIGYPVMQWKIITPILILLTFILAIPLKSKSFLYLGAIFLLLYISDIAGTFIDKFGDIGWSLILVVAGLILMAVGYLVIYLHRKM